MKEHLASQGLEAVGNSPREFGDYLRAEQGKWAKVVRTSGATVD
jgi:tripartite-type tricarboxylate transporter receptor subunit TctC